jgi:hypothetical protein
MAEYTIYHPGPKPPEIYLHSYCTHLLIDSLANILTENNHSVDITYVNNPHRQIVQIDENNEETSDDNEKEKSPLLEGMMHIKIPELDLYAVNCPSSLWFILANNETKKFILFDLQDSPGAAYKMLDHENLIFVFSGQFSYERLRIESQSKNVHKFLPFVYTAYYPKLTKSLREEIQESRRSLEKLDDRIFFYGNNRDTYVHSDEHGNKQKIREVISVLAEKYPDESCVGSWEDKLPLVDFFKKAATHTINLALPGHPWCSREHELWTLGLPVMMYEPTHHMSVPLIPNYHYVAVPGGPRLSIGMAKDPELAADRIIEIHREWIKPENRWRVDAVARHGQERMDKYADYDVVWDTILPLLELGHW